MSSLAPRRRELALVALAGVGLALAGAWGLSVRLPEGADFPWKLAVNGPRLLIAVAVGAGLAASGVVARATAPGSLREAYRLTVSFGAAFGASRAGALEDSIGVRAITVGWGRSPQPL